MKSANWKDIAELVAISAVVASLIFVGLQMRQTQEIAQATLYQMRSDSAQEIRLAMIFPEQLQSGMSKQDAELTGPEQQSMNSLMSMVLDHFENSHHLYQLGMLSEEQWDSDLEQLTRLLGRQIALDRWTTVKETYRSSFAEEVDAIYERIDIVE